MKILVVEDDVATANMIKNGLESGAHTVEVALDGADGSFLARSFEFDAIVLDYSMPKKDGLTVCDEIRQAGKKTPIIFLSIEDETSTKVAALKHGADDYLTKPFSIEELNARLQAITRRTPNGRESIIKIGDLLLDFDKQIASRGDDVLKLTRKEFCLLEFLMSKAGTFQSRAAILEHVWTIESDPLSNTVEVHIKNLRQKMNAGDKANMIINIIGRGYILDTPENIAILTR